MITQIEAQSDQEKCLNTLSEMNKCFSELLKIVAPHVSYPQLPEPKILAHLSANPKDPDICGNIKYIYMLKIFYYNII